MTKKYIELATIKPSYALTLKYSRKLHKLISLMTDDVTLKLLKTYENKEPKIAMDENIPQQFNNQIDKLFKYWFDIFNSNIGIFSEQFVNDVDQHNYNQNNIAIKKLSDLDKQSENLTIKFSKESKQVLKAKQSIIQEQINLITNIPNEYKNKVNEVVFEAISRGRDFKYLKSELLQVNTITEKRAKLIAKNQIDYATGVINLARASDLGFTKSKWKHSSASKEPRKSHKEANNKIFNTAEGCLIDDEYIVPGQKINCNCYTVVVIEI